MPAKPFPHADAAFVGVAGDDCRRFGGELRNALEHILRSIGSKIGDQLVVDGEVWGQYEKVADRVSQVKVADKGPHQPGLAHSGGKRKAQGRKVAFEVLDRGELGADGLQHGGDIGILAGRGNLRNAVQDFQRPALGRT